MPSVLVPTWLLLAAPDPAVLAPAQVDEVDLPWTQVQRLQALAADDPGAAPPGPWVQDREVRLVPVEGGFELEASWIIEARTPGWLWQRLLGPGIELRSATLDGARAPILALPDGPHLAAWLEQGARLQVRAFVPGSIDEPIALALMPATRGRLRIAASGRVPVALVDETTGEAPPLLDGGTVWSGASQMRIRLRDPDRAPAARASLAVAHAGVGLTVGDAELRGRAHLQWELRHGSLDRVRATVAWLGDDLTLEGRNVASWSRDGDVLEVVLSSPATARVDLQLTWSQAVPATDETSLPLPRIEPQAWRSDASLQVARDGELEVIPRAEDWTAIATGQLPPWGQGLVEGTPTAAYRHGAGSAEGTLDLLRFVPVPGPPTVVDVASYTLATTEEGRVLMRAQYQLRNDRGGHLTVRPPPGLRIIGARVAGETSLPSRDDEGAWRLPLKRSLETVDGLLSFPVEVIMLGEQEPWQRRERRQLPLPTVDAPIAAAHVTLHLPPRYRSRLEPGEHDVVDEFSEGEGLTYGLGLGEAESAAAEVLFQEAVEGYLGNDFGQAQDKLEQLEQLGVRNENMSRLQSNIDVIEGRTEAEGKGDLALQRRVKEQARARASEQFLQQEVLIEEAEKAASAGDYAAAQAQYEAAIEIGGELAKLEQTESVEQVFKNADLEAELSTVAKKKVSKRDQRNRGKARNQLDTRFYNPSSEVHSGRASVDATLGSSVNGTKDDPAVPEEPDDEPAPDDETEADDAYSPEPEPEPDLPSSDTASYDSLDEERAAPPRRSASRRRGRGRLQGRMRFKRSRGSRSSAAMSMGARARDEPAASVSVYDFEDDDLDGELLRPEGANLDSRASRDFRAVVDSSATATRDQPAPRDPTTVVDEDAAGAMLGDAVTDDYGTDPARLDALPAPEVTASALSVVIPATGAAVRYEQVLIEANQTQTIIIDARRRLRRR
ncbi:MAG: hypothetical protein AB1Z98_10315 [Nannocystaceae bacterium]